MGVALVAAVDAVVLFGACEGVDPTEGDEFPFLPRIFKSAPKIVPANPPTIPLKAHTNRFKTFYQII